MRMKTIKADLEKAVKDAETEEANLYTEDSYKAFEAALKTAKYCS